MPDSNTHSEIDSNAGQGRTVEHGGGGQWDRFRRQIQYALMGEQGQQRLAAARVAVVGVGALGSVIAERLARAGVGYLRLIDRDWVELDNLPRQTLFTEADVHTQQPKSIAAAGHLKEIYSAGIYETHVEDLTDRNADRLLSGVDLIMDGTDNFETRFLINDYALEKQIPWVHGGCLGASGQVMTIVPGVTACFRCVMREMPPAEEMATCDTAGVLGPAVTIIAAWQCIEAIKILTQNFNDIVQGLLVFDIWSGDVRRLELNRLTQSHSCPACQLGHRDFLEGRFRSDTRVLCGRNAVQIQPVSDARVDLIKLAERISKTVQVQANAFFLKFSIEEFIISIFADGRAIVSGTDDPAQARAVYAKWIGS